MPELSRAGDEKILSIFHEHNAVQSQRTVQRTQQAIAQLEAQGQKITLAALGEATRALDGQGKGLAPATILRNPRARELFQQHSSAYRLRQMQLTRCKRKPRRAKARADVCAAYRGLRAADLVQLIEELKQTVAQLKAHQSKLQAERDEAYQRRDEALQQNTKQLAALTRLQGRGAVPCGKAESLPQSVMAL